MYELSREIWQTMRTNKLRTILTGISVAWGIFMLVLLLALSNGVANMSSDFQQSNNPYRISVWPGTTTKAYKGMKEGRNIQLRNKHIKMLENADPEHIANVEGNVSFSPTISTLNNYISGNATGIHPSFMKSSYKMLYGRKINAFDLKESRKVIVLHKSKAAILFDDITTAVGKNLKIGDLSFTLVGIYDHDWDDSSYIPYTTTLGLLGFNPPLNSMEVNLQNINSADDADAVENLVKQTLARSEQFDETDEAAIYTRNRYQNYLENIKASSYLNIAMWVIGILTLITGIVGVSNIMFVSVKERTHEIGIRRAIGAKRRSILSQVVIESVALTTVFGYTGVVMGVAATEIAKKVLEHTSLPLRPELDIRIAFQVLIALIVAGALAGIFPAFKATKVRPVEALAEE